ncbi:MAG: hypothetical protein KF723_09570 [Rhizobiaceae bacterium]|nr:hypothetical protein [Rhizobiaceae bacterium]
MPTIHGSIITKAAIAVERLRNARDLDGAADASRLDDAANDHHRLDSHAMIEVFAPILDFGKDLSAAEPSWRWAGLRS